MTMWRALLAVTLLTLIHGLAVTVVAAEEPQDEAKNELPWDFDPYRVMIWIAGSDETTVQEEWKAPIQAFLDRDYRAVWRTEIAAAPPSLSALAGRNFSSVNYEALSADDPVLAMKRNHEAAARIRYPADIATNLKSIRVVESYAEAVRQRGAAVDNADLHGMAPLFQPIDGDLLDLQEQWADPATEAVMLPIGLARGLEPAAKLVELEVAGRMDRLFANYDKLFIVLVEGTAMNKHISVREIDAPMRLAGPIAEMYVSDARDVPAAIARSVSKAFAPVVRLEDVGTDTAEGRLRAGGLILDPASPAAVAVGDYLQPVLRKDGRSGEPTMLGIVDWTYLRVEEQDVAKLVMKLHSGRSGTLQGRRNSRTHRMALKIRPTFPATILRLHAKGNPDEPLVGYDVYEKDLETDEMTLIGSTDWDGRLVVEKTGNPLRLLYVKNGSAVLARLPLVPGQSRMETADLVADDMRLRAEAYIRGVQNAIIDVVAIRKLFASAIRLHIKEGNLEKAGELLDNLRKEPTFQTLANDMEQKATEIRSRNGTIQRRIDNLFGETRDLMRQHLSPTLVRELEGEFFAAGGAELGQEPAEEATPPSEQPPVADENAVTASE